MPITINAKGLACPQPVMLARKALDESDDIIVLVDNTTALENIRRLAASSDCSIEVVNETDGTFAIRLGKNVGAPAAQSLSDIEMCDAGVEPLAGPAVAVLSSDCMGRGDDDLGRILMKAFVHTLVDIIPRPDYLVLYNTGVKLAAADSPVRDDLSALEAAGVTILVCGTCVNYFNLGNSLGAGGISNMFDIAGLLSRAGRIINP